MIFHEIYGSYYRTVASIIQEAQKGALDKNAIYRIAYRKAFGESAIYISQALADGRWPLLNPDFSTPIRTTPRLPLTKIEKAWLKTILQDSRIRLFLPAVSRGEAIFPGIDLSDVAPLFQPEDIIYYDQRACGDPYDTKEYQAVFRTILDALPKHEKLSVTCKNHEYIKTIIPLYLEYSQRTDTFRLIALEEGGTQKSLHLADITACTRSGESLTGETPFSALESDSPATSLLTLLLNDHRNALERFLMEFSDLKTETEQIGTDSYRISVSYWKEDEQEVVMRLLAFGPLLRVTGPDSVVESIREKLLKPVFS